MASIETIEQVTSRKVFSFHSTCDAHNGIVIEIAIFASPESGSDGDDAV